MKLLLTPILLGGALVQGLTNNEAITIAGQIRAKIAGEPNADLIGGILRLAAHDSMGNKTVFRSPPGHNPMTSSLLQA